MRAAGCRTASQGFSLLEVIVALGIVTVGVTSVLALFASGVDVHKRSIDQSNASLAALSIASELEARYTMTRIDAWKKKVQKKNKKISDSDFLADIPAKGEEYPPVPGFSDYVYGVEFYPLDPDANAVLARINILWRGGGGRPVTEEFRTVLLKRPY